MMSVYFHVVKNYNCIVPLTYQKNFQNPILSNIWINIIRRLGNSLPDADYEDHLRK